MFVVPHRVRPNLNGKRGVIATAPIRAGMPVWYAGPGDIVLGLDDIKRLTPLQFEAFMALGWVRLSYSRQWVVAGDFHAVNWADHKTPANLKAEFDILTATRKIKANEELIFPVELNADTHWLRRMYKPGSWKREGDGRAAKADLPTYLRYIRKQG